ncbi:MAG: flippase-like domain-containing protein [Bacilli bacterium]|nr:flippase-like domain-containing protein [Bacilli bacterium]
MEKVLTKEDIKAYEESPNPKKKKSGLYKYVIYISLVLVATGIALFLALRKDPQGVFDALASSDYRWILAIIGVMFFSLVVDALVIYIFMRLYTRKYHLHQGAAVSMIGYFYGSITPGAKGGQVMQAYALRNQGTQISNAASILVMYFILYNIAVVIFNLIAVIFKFSLFKEIGSVPITIGNFSANLSLVPLTIIGFLFSLSIVGLLFLMSYSHRMHNFVMHYGVGFLAKIKILKHPDKTRESLRIQVENFKIELRRLLSNIPITIVIISLFFVGLICEYSIPWFAGMAVNGYGYHEIGGEIVHTAGYPTIGSMFDACFLSCYHQMISGLIPIPGGAGISEILFSKLFENYYTTPAAISASQIIWRGATFYAIMLVSGLVTALYKASPKKQAEAATDRRTFVTMQLETYEERKQSSDASFASTQVTRKENQQRIKEIVVPKSFQEKKRKKEFELDDQELYEESPFHVDSDLVKPLEQNKKKRHKKDDRDWGSFDL